MTITQLREHAGRKIGLPDSFDGSISAYRNLTPAQQVELTRAMIAYIASNPGSFTPAQVETATIEGPRIERAAIENTDFDYHLFMTELELNAKRVIADPLISIGEGVSSSVALAGKLIPIALIVALIIFALPYIKKAQLPAS